MTTAAFLTDLKRRGVEIWADGDRLRYNAPAGLIDDDLREELRRQKPHLLELLRQTASPPTAAAPRPAERKILLTGNERLLPQSVDDLPVHYHPYARHVAPYRSFLFSHLGLDKRFVRGEHCSLFDEKGVRYLDMVAQFGALAFGYNPPDIWDALLTARERPTFVNPSLMDTAGELAARLVRIAPGDMPHVTFANSGAEAVEVAIKLVRSATRRGGILATRNAFHGLTLGSMSATGRDVFQKHFGAPVPGFDRVPYGDLDALRSALAARPGYYAGFIVEPIQGEGGIVVPPPGYFAAAAQACRAGGVRLIADEVQTGLGRTGAMFASEHEQLAPDVLVVAKALGGGLLPVGACIYTREVYNPHFEMWHSSTFAGNTLACAAGLAALDRLEAHDGRLIRQVAENGALLRRELAGLQERFPRLITEVRGRGYMLGVELGLDDASLGSDLLAHLAEQQLLLHLLVGYLLNVEHIRVAPAFTGAAVLRIEPPLVAGPDECAELVRGLERMLTHLHAGDAGALLSYMVGDAGETSTLRPSATVTPPPTMSAPRRRRVEAGATRFAFLVHLLSSRDYADFDDSLARFSDSQLADLHRRISHFVEPFPVGEIAVRSTAGGNAVGELILVPHTAEELMRLPAETALGEVLRAAEIARARGAGIVGLGGFTSVVTQGGMSLKDPRLPPLTNGNSFTVAMARRAVELACRERGVDLAAATVAVVGAGGNIGRAAALLMPADAARMILVGNPSLPQRSLARLMETACEVAACAGAARRGGAGVDPRSLAAYLADLAERAGPRPDDLRAALEADDRLVLTTDFDGMLPLADIVITATNSVDVLIFERHLKPHAIVCDVSRPFNVCRDVRQTRPDVMLIDGGTVHVGADADLAALRGTRPGHVPACMAETILLAFERSYDMEGLSGALQLDTIHRVTGFGRKHGFDVVLHGDDWELGDVASPSRP